ncbi:hypothetical protein [Cohnella silvisoli]|uniref:Uncharacterized protein n=1 Tax=Cohnella silvisoli TaxID=2873699 RepID=A0ABV1L1D6_9BACL|nr:hypothetical protein [Cohnella silvisoli]MCD9025017.1 hypothetical protein [Cohnella silvisoli]
MSIEQYENFQHGNEIFIKLNEAELEAKNSDIRYGHDEVFDKIKMQLNNGREEK